MICQTFDISFFICRYFDIYFLIYSLSRQKSAIFKDFFCRRPHECRILGMNPSVNPLLTFCTNKNRFFKVFALKKRFITGKSSESDAHLVPDVASVLG